MALIDRAFNSEHGFSIDDKVGILYSTTDPTSGAGIDAPVGSLLLYVPSVGTPKVFKKKTSTPTDWEELGSASADTITGTGASGQYAEFNGDHTLTSSVKNTAFNPNFETSTSNIKINGSVSVGALGTVARADHIHPTDTSREPTLTKGNLSGSFPVSISGGANAIIGTGVNVSVSSATTTSTGVVQLSNSYSGTSQTLAVTEKALSDGIASITQTIEVLAAESISLYSVVTTNGYNANSSTSAHNGRIAGISITSTGSGFMAEVIPQGEVENVGWSWSAGEQIFLNGTNLSTTAPTSGFRVIIGSALSSTKLLVAISECILL